MKAAQWIIIALGIIALLCACSIVVTAAGLIFFASERNGTAPTAEVFEAPADDVSENDNAGETPDTPPAELTYGTNFSPTECQFTTTTNRVTCGWLTVPEDRQNPEQGTIQLAVAIVSAANGDANAEPIVYLEGGPGGQALFDVEYLWVDSDLTDQNIVILLDQRGNGYSQPSLNCVEMETDEYRSDDAAMQACYQRLQNEGVDLTQYNSEESAADVRDLILALGYKQAHLLGISYGTRLGLTVMRDHPEVVQSAILDSVYPPNGRAGTDTPLYTLTTLQRLFDGCAQHPACNANYPNLDTVFEAVVVELNNNPVTVEFWDDEYEEYYDYDLWGDDVIYEMVDLMYDSRIMAYLPAYIYALYEGDHGYAYDILDYGAEISAASGTGNETYLYDDWEYLDEDISDAEGQYYSVECREEYVFDDLDTARSLVAGYSDDLTYALLDDTQYFMETCNIWNVGRGGSYETEAVVSDIPTLMINGTYDIATPAEWARLATETLSNVQYFEFPGFGHGLIDSECGLALMVSFLENPNVAVDDSCYQALPATPDFYID